MEKCNIGSYLEAQYSKFPGEVAVILPEKGEQKSYFELHTESNGIAECLLSKGIGEGTRVLVMVRPGYELILITFALLKMGAIPVIIDPGMGLKNFLHCLNQARPQVLVGTSMALYFKNIFFRNYEPIRLILNIRSLIKASRPSLKYEVVSLKPDSLGAIVFTSGSTGPPKGVCYTHTMFNAQIELLKNTFNLRRGEVDLPMLPIFILFNPALGVTSVVPKINPSRPIRLNPEQIVRYIDNYKVTTSFGSPVLWEKILNYIEKNDISLPSLKRIFMAGCTVPKSLIKRFYSIQPHICIHTPYGATEGLPITSVTAKERLENTDYMGGVLVGKPVDNVQVKIISILEQPISRFFSKLELPAQQVGEIIASGPNVSKEYFNNPVATYYSKIYGEQKVWHRTGDLGYIDKGGNVYFCGRLKERVKTRASVFYTEPIEALFNEHPLVLRSALLGATIPGTNFKVPFVVIQPKPVPSLLIRKLKSYKFLLKEIKQLALNYPLTRNIKHFLICHSFPVDVRHNAKIHRLSLAKKFEKKIQ